MGERLYNNLVTTFKVIIPAFETIWEIPYDGEPCVFVGNHCGLWGPVDMMVHFPLKDSLCPWFNAAVMNKDEVPAYVRQDYWWKPGCTLEPLYDATLPYMAAAVLPPILQSVPNGIPVYHDNRAMLTMRQSIRHLDQGQNLLIFPEQPSGYKSHHTWINTGFMNVAPIYHRRSGRVLKFWPVHIDHKAHRFIVSAPIAFDPERILEEQLSELETAMAYGLRGGKTTDVKD